jgi:hypothetical protein
MLSIFKSPGSFDKTTPYVNINSMDSSLAAIFEYVGRF